MNKKLWLNLYVAFVAVLAASAVLWAERAESLVAGPWQVVCFIVIGFMLDLAANPLRVAATGSVSFIVFMSAGLLYGGFWGAWIAAVSTLLSQLAHQRPVQRIVFNISQRSLAIAAAILVYKAIGGGLPPVYLSSVGPVEPGSLQRDLGFFFVFAAVFFAVNTISVSAVIAISSGQKFREVWYLNSKGVVGYDLGASALAMLVAWLFHRAEEGAAYGPFGLLGVFVIILTIRHIYGMYRKLQSSGRELLDLMVKAIEARDPYTSGHSIRVATLAKAIAQECGMPTAEVEQVYTAALLHDVGKIHEEFAPLLRKDSKLTPDEMALLQTHPVKSADLVGIISSFRGMVQDAVRSHHERWDGKGYPDGVAGEMIPRGARMIMISDTIDAMSTDRPYRKRLPLEAVLAELQRHKGAQFDPLLVEITINSVNVRRVISDLQGVTSDIKEPSSQLDLGGSQRALKQDLILWRPRRVL
jgi:putative nucleotidyltransferase with HDIG domain